MPDKTFRVTVFDVDERPKIEGRGHTPFDRSINNAMNLSMPEREKMVAGKYRRLELASFDRIVGVFLMNVVTLDYAGPSRTRRGQRIRPFNMQSDESFVSETALLYDPNRDLALVEATQSGIGYGSLAAFFEQFAAPRRPTTYEFVPRMDADAAARARLHQTIRNLSLRVAIGRTTEADRAAGISPFAALGNNYGAGYIDVEIKSERPRRRTLDVGSVWDFISNLTSGNTAVPSYIERLRVTGREDDDSRQEVIDLIQHRERRDMPLPIDPQTRKTLFRDRRDALVEIYSEFISSSP